jgi:hypothetical protein
MRALSRAPHSCAVGVTGSGMATDACCTAVVRRERAPRRTDIDLRCFSARSLRRTSRNHLLFVIEKGHERGACVVDDLCRDVEQLQQ